ncbi:MAG: 1-deoxy-D-xylulose-5-phosphate synthase [Gammaproteobacteria bacterium]|nr:1-deoxy-D-xylulose-5-phosphate synthase [Gammaproteobacteria bacterium]
MHFSLLPHISSPQDLRQLKEGELITLAEELRHFILDATSQVGGHLAGGLGVIELTIALHTVFSTPNDLLVWDVGHQTYPHKVLTGRKDRIATIRKKGGLSGFPKREESPYDTFGVGHSSTSISAALGMAVALSKQKREQKVVAIIGDGGLTAGMAFEALNHAGDIHADLLVILNDNDMSISHNVGALSNYFAKVLSGKLYANIRESGKKVLERVPGVWELARRTEEHFKGMVVPGTLFEELGFNYCGPVDGHDLPTLLKILRQVKTLKGPQFLHVVTQKGRGYPPAEAKPITYHAVSPFDVPTGKMTASKSARPSFSQIFGEWLCDMAEVDKRLVGITPAMREGSGMVEFSERFKTQYMDVGIAEQHSLTFAAGLACQGLKPVVAIYSTFLQRAYDQLIHDVALQNLPVLFAIDRAGLVGQDGPTHSGNFDLSYLRCIPNMVVMVPSNEDECRQMLYTGYGYEGPAAVRYPRGTGPGVPVQKRMAALPIGRADCVRHGERVAILAFGPLLSEAQKAAERCNATVINMRFVKPLDEEMIQKMASQHELLITLEDNAIMGGAGSAVSEHLAKLNLYTPIVHLGIPDRFIEHATAEEQLKACGLTAEHIHLIIENHLSKPDQAKCFSLCGSGALTGSPT